MDDIETLYVYEDEKRLIQRLREEYDERRKKLIDKLKNGYTESNNISEDGEPTMDYHIQSYDNYGAHGPIEPLVLVEGESKPNEQETEEETENNEKKP